MTPTVFRGGSMFDGSGAAPSPADVSPEAGRIVGVGPGSATPSDRISSVWRAGKPAA